MCDHADHLRRKRGFTLLEISIVVAIIGLLCAIALPAFVKSRRQTQFTRIANNLRVFGDALAMYAMQAGQFPADAHLDPPFPPGSGVEEYLDIDKWKSERPLGGQYNWEGPDGYPYAGISLFGATAAEADAVEVDKICDDGDLATGIFRKTPNGRYTYIIEE
jgi:type IV pilus assembly protein PilA